MTGQAKCPRCARSDCVNLVDLVVLRGYFAGLCMTAIRADQEWAVRLATIAALDGGSKSES